MAFDKTYRLYIFDLDGTLVDTKLDIALAMQKVMAEAGFEKPSLDEVEKAIGGGARNAVSKLTGLEGDALTPLLEKFVAAYEVMCADHTTVYEGGEELVQRLKSQGAKLAVVTMKLRVPTHKILKHHALYDLMDTVLTFDDIEKRKPDPDSLFALLKQYDVKPEDAVVIGDTVTDLKYAHNAGADACAVSFGYGDLEDLKALSPRYMINHFFEV